MATSQDKAQKFKEALRGKGPQIFMGAMALLLAGRIYLFMQESGFQNTDIKSPRIMSAIPSAIKPETEVKVNQMINQKPEFTTTTFYNLSVVNMFDPKAAQNSDSFVNRATQFVASAQAAFDRKSYGEAETMLKEAFKVAPSLGSALALREKIKAATTSSTLAQGQPTPVAGATPAASPTPAR